MRFAYEGRALALALGLLAAAAARRPRPQRTRAPRPLRKMPPLHKMPPLRTRALACAVRATARSPPGTIRDGNVHVAVIDRRALRLPQAEWRPTSDAEGRDHGYAGEAQRPSLLDDSFGPKTRRCSTRPRAPSVGFTRARAGRSISPSPRRSNRGPTRHAPSRAIRGSPSPRANRCSSWWTERGTSTRCSPTVRRRSRRPRRTLGALAGSLKLPAGWSFLHTHARRRPGRSSPPTNR